LIQAGLACVDCRKTADNVAGHHHKAPLAVYFDVATLAPGWGLTFNNDVNAGATRSPSNY